MKLTNIIRSNIVKQIIDDVFIPKQKAHEDILRKEAERFVFVINNRKQDIDPIFNNIKEYINISDKVVFNFKIKSEWRTLRENVIMEKQVVLLLNEYDELQYNIGENNDPVIYKILVAGNNLEDEKRTAEKSLNTVLHSVNTIKQLLDLKPDFEKYIVDNEKPKQMTALIPQKDLDRVSNILKEANINKEKAIDII